MERWDVEMQLFFFNEAFYGLMAWLAVTINTSTMQFFLGIHFEREWYFLPFNLYLGLIYVPFQNLGKSKIRSESKQILKRSILIWMAHYLSTLVSPPIDCSID